MSEFRTELGSNIFYQKYALTQAETWRQKAITTVEGVAGPVGDQPALMSKEEREELIDFMTDFIFLPGGRYIYYAGRKAKFWNNCYLFKSQEDSREDWADLANKATEALMTGGGIGNDYSVYREEGLLLSRTGGKSSGPIPLMKMINEIGRNVMQGGSRRSAIYASLNWQHGDIDKFLEIKDWDNQQVGNSGMTIGDLKRADFNFPAPLDMTNISVNYDDDFLEEIKPAFWEGDAYFACLEDQWENFADYNTLPEVFLKNIEMAMRNGEPGFSFNFFEKGKETARNACTEVTSADDSDVCNLGSINLARCKDIQQFKRAVELGSKFLVCGTIRAELPNEKIKEVRERNRRLGLGLMGVHEWLLQRGERYEVTPELHDWLQVYQQESERAANEHCDRFFLSRPKAYRAIAPTGTIGILAGTTTGIEPLYAVAYKRRYLVDGDKWRYEYVVDHMAQTLIDQGIDPENIETAVDLAADPERRIKFQADVQDYVDMSISSTLNLPAWGSKLNNENRVAEMATIVAKYAPRLRGLTFYPDGARGGQPITTITYEEAMRHKGVIFEDNESCVGGVCGL